MFRHQQNASDRSASACRAVVIWIDWYAYHLARFEGLQAAFGRAGQVVGIELVGGVGVHTGLKFREDRPADSPIETLFPEGSWRKTSKLAMSVRLWRRLTELDPEIVLVPGYYTLPAVAAAAWARLHQRNSVLMTESTEVDHGRKPWKELLKSAVIRTLFNWAVAGGAAHARYLTKLGFPANRIRRFYDVVGNAHIGQATKALRERASREQFGLPPKYFLYVGRLAPEKNVAGLLQAWMEYRNGGGSWSLVLAGDGPEASALRAMLFHSRWAGEVIFAGHKTSEDLLTYFSFASCFVLASIREPWGLVVNEAMAASLPVIVSTRCGCAEELVTGSNGLVFEVSHKSELISCLDTIEQRSEEELAAMGTSSWHRIQSYSPLNFGSEIAAICASKDDLLARVDARTEETV